MDKLLNTILNLIESTVLEYELLTEDTVRNFPIMVIRCNIRKADLSCDNQYFLAIQDMEGPHCVDWSPHRELIEERLEHWKGWLKRGSRELYEYSFPDIIPIRRYTLKEIKEKQE
jgi:hypothetical protein